jgi:hypothetical protein
MEISDNIKFVGDIIDKITEHDNDVLGILNLICTTDTLIISDRGVLSDYEMFTNVIYTLLKIDATFIYSIINGIISAKDDISTLNNLQVDINDKLSIIRLQLLTNNN